MNQKQREYATNRATAIAKNRITAAEIEHRVLGHKLSRAEVYAALKLGNFEVKPLEMWGYPNRSAHIMGLGEVLIFPDETEPSVLPGLDEKVAAIKAQEAKVKDLIMLGDSAEALRWLDAFGTGQPVESTNDEH